jgi:hypothetical protein
MRRFMPRIALGSLVALGLLAGGYLAFAQVSQITSRTLSGSEVVVVANSGPGGASFFAPTGQLRNAQNTITSAATSGTVSSLTNTNVASFISTAACGGAMTVNLPATPWDGEIFEWVNGSGGAFTTGCVVATTDGSSIVNGAGVTTLGAGVSTEWRYSLGTNSWYRMR